MLSGACQILQKYCIFGGSVMGVTAFLESLSNIGLVAIFPNCIAEVAILLN